MMLNAYCIFDSASNVFQRPFFCGADGEATRLFVDLVAEKEHPVGKHPMDYSVFRVGRFDDSQGALLPDELKECLITGHDVIRKESQPANINDLAEGGCGQKEKF